MKINEFNFSPMSVKIPEYEFNLKATEFQKTNEEFTIWFFEGIIENYPNYLECLMYLGNAYTSEGMFDKGLQLDLKLIELKPHDPVVHYNLACSYSLLGKTDLAFASLSKSIDLGYRDIKHLENDRDLDRLRNEEQYKIILNKLKETKEKHLS